MRYNTDSFARLVGGAVKLANPQAGIDTFADSGYVTLPNGQVFRFAVEEVTPEVAAALRWAHPESETGDPDAT